MNQKAALAQALLSGEVVSIMSCFKMMGITNAPREIGRSIERSFGVEVSRIRKKAKTRYGGECTYFEYRLDKTKYNSQGIKLMAQYVKEQLKSSPSPRTDKEKARNKQISLFLDTI